MFQNRNRDTAVFLPTGQNKRNEQFLDETPNDKRELDEITTQFALDSLQKMKEQAWESYEITSEKCLRRQDKAKRQKLLKYLLSDIGPHFQLSARTIEHTIKLLDIYLSHKPSIKPILRRFIYPDNQVTVLDMLTCLFLSCKYNEIYPPILPDLIGFCSVDVVNKKDYVLEKELIILQCIDLNMNVALVSDWWKIVNKQTMPIWAYLCYLDFDLKNKSKYIFEEITRFSNYIKNSSYKAAYEQFLKRSDETWRAKNSGIQASKRFSADCFVMYDTFVEFRVKRELSKLSLLSLNSGINNELKDIKK